MRAMTLSFLAATAVTLSAQSLPADAQCKLILVEEWRVRSVNNHILIDGAINGQPVGVVLDTGASRTVIFRSAAERLGLLTRLSKRNTTGVGGLSQLSSAHIEEFRLGQSTRKDWRMLIAGERDPGTDIAVLLGEDFFRQFDVEFDLSENAVRLFQSRDCDGRPLAYWNEAGADQVTFEGSDANPQILVPVRLNGQGLSAVLDSGASRTVVNKTVAAGLGVNPDSPNVVYGGNQSGIGARLLDSWIAPFESLEIGKEVISNPNIAFHHLGTETPMLLGLDFLRSHRLLIAHSQRKIYFTYSAPKSATAEAKSRSAPTCNQDADCGGKSECSSGGCPRSPDK